LESVKLLTKLFIRQVKFSACILNVKKYKKNAYKQKVLKLANNQISIDATSETVTIFKAPTVTPQSWSTQVTS